MQLVDCKHLEKILIHSLMETWAADKQYTLVETDEGTSPSNA